MPSFRGTIDPVDLARMLERCRRDQWSVADLDWSAPPPAMPAEKEQAVVQYFTDMAWIERMAGALFHEQGEKTEDPVLKEIFRSFERDEIRHSHVAQMLADHYDVHRHRVYQPNESMMRFYPAFVRAIRYLTPEVANVYITTGELILDVALLRSLTDYVGDETSKKAMELINRDESRHIAIDFHMVERYSMNEQSGRGPPRPLRDRAEGWIALSSMLVHARPFLKSVFFDTMDRIDPSGKRLIEAYKRAQLLSTKPAVASRPFVRFMLTMQDLFNQPVIGFFFGRILLRIVGTDARVMAPLYTEEERRRAQAMSFDDLAEEALRAKHG